jgi:hypothetical protein
LERAFSVDMQGIFHTSSLLNKINGHELASGFGDEFKVVIYIKEFLLIMNSVDFLYQSHRFLQEGQKLILTVTL